jgi:hypothetical protein
LSFVFNGFRVLWEAGRGGFQFASGALAGQFSADLLFELLKESF